MQFYWDFLWWWREARTRRFGWVLASELIRVTWERLRHARTATTGMHPTLARHTGTTGLTTLWAGRSSARVLGSMATTEAGRDFMAAVGTDMAGDLDGMADAVLHQDVTSMV